MFLSELHFYLFYHYGLLLCFNDCYFVLVGMPFA